MPRPRSLALPALLALFVLPPATAAPNTIAPFAATDTAGKPWALPDAKAAPVVVVVFTAPACPVCAAYQPALAKLHADYRGKGVTFVAVSAFPADGGVPARGSPAGFNLPFPVLKDDGGRLAERFGAEAVPEAFVLDAARTVRYRGRIDDQFGVGFRRPAPTRRDLAAALDEVLAGKPVAVPRTDADGCALGRTAAPAAKPTVTYGRDVARIVRAHCQECHRPGQAAPMALTTADDLAAWAGMVKQVVRSDRMPPWHADPRFGRFANDRRLSAADKRTLIAWIDQGCPPGDPADVPPPRAFPDGWHVGTPDVVVTMPEAMRVPAAAGAGGVAYQYFRVPTDFGRDVWVRVAEARPGAREVVHHVAVFVIPLDAPPRSDTRAAQDLLAAYAPGELPAVYPPGFAKKIPRGATLLFQVHYTPDGTPRTDQSAVGLVFAKEPPRHEVKSRSASNAGFVIPPGADDVEVKAQTTFRGDVLLLSLLPHMHLRGKAFTVEAAYPDGRRETLLSVPRYDFNWQINYRLAAPLRLPAGTRLECTARYDNSAGNKNNPDPTAAVRWGDQTWDEMMVGFVDYADAGK